MATVKNILLSVTGTSEEAQQSLHAIADEIRRLPNTRTVAVKAEIAQADTKLKALQAHLQELDRTTTEPKVRLQIAKASADIDRFRGKLAELGKSDAEVSIKTARAQGQIKRLEDEIRRLRATPADITVAANIRKAEADIAVLQERLAHLAEAGDEVDVSVHVEKAEAQIQVLEARLAKLNAERPDVTVNADVGAAEAKIALLRIELERLQKAGHLNLTARGSLLRDLSKIESGVVNLAGSLENAQGQGSTFSTFMSSLGQQIASLSPKIQGTLIVLVTALIPGIIALGTSALSAAGGVAVLGNALLVAFGPAVAVAVAVIARLVAVMKAKQAQDQASATATRKGNEASAAAAQHADQLRSATNRLRDAREGLVTAERDLAQAQEQASADIAAAQREQASAARDVGDAQENLRRQTTAAYEAMRQSVQDVTDAVLGLEEAQQGVDEANLRFREAQKALADYRKEIGATGTAFDSLFKKFTDVDFNFNTGALTKALAAQGGVGGGGDELKLERLILDVRQARLGEKQATDDVAKSQENLNEKRRTEADFARRGIAAFAPYRQAVRQVGDAQAKLADATAKATKLERAGVEKAPAVIAAHERVRDAIQGVADAEHNLERTRTAPLAGTVDQAERAKQAWDNLSAAEQGFLTQLRNTVAYLKGYFGPITDGVIRGLTSALANAPALLGPLRGAFATLGSAMGDAITRVVDALTSPVVIGELQSIVGASAQLARILGGRAFSAFLRIMLALATAAMPALLRLSRQLAGWLERVAGGLEGAGKAHPIIDAMVASFRAWVGLVGALGRVLGGAFRAIAPQGDSLLRWITEGIDKFAAFLNSAKGRNSVGDFFHDTMPLVKSIIGFVVRLGKVFFAAFRFVAPILKPTIDVFNTMLDILGFLLGLLNKIPTPVRTVVGVLLSFILPGRIIAALARGIEAIPLALQALVPAATRVIEGFLGVFRGAVAVITRLFRVSRWLNLGRSIIGGIVKGLTAAAHFLFEGARWLLTKYIASWRALGGLIVRLGRTVVGWIVSGVKAAVGLIVGVAGFLIARYIDSWKALGRLVIGAGRWVVQKVVDGVKAAAGLVRDIGKWLLHGLVDGFTSIGQWVWNAIKGLAGKIVDAVKSVLGIHSPSRVMRRLGEHMLAGLIEGFTSGDVVGFIKRHLGGIQSLASKFGLSTGFTLDPFSIVKLLGEKAGGAAANLAGLARGGLVVGPSIRTLGEGAYDEAVLPLSRSVMRQLAQAIAAEMQFAAPAALGRGARPALAGAGAGGSRNGVNIEKVVLPPGPAGSVPDPRYSAAQFMSEIRRRGRGYR